MKTSALFVTAAVLLAGCSADSILPTDPTSSTGSVRADVGAAASTPRSLVSAVGPNLCGAVAYESSQPGTRVVTWTCDSTLSARRFALQSSGLLTVEDGTRCVDVLPPKAKGAEVVIWTCAASEATQHWTLTAAGELTNVQGLCLTVAFEDAVPGRYMVLWPCNGGPAQKWTVASDGALATTTTASAGGSTPDVGTAELPRVYLSTAAPAVTGRTISVPAGGDLQGALNAAQPGDQVVLAAGATYVGNFTLPAKPGMTTTQWITVRGAGSLPAEGTRVGPANAGQMPKIVTPIVTSAISTAPGAQGWRLTGLEVFSTSSLGWAYDLVSFGTVGSDQQTAAQVPSRIVLDRSYVHGSASFRIQRCVVLNSASTAVVDSYLADCHDRGGDSQAIIGWNGPGPYKIVNNYLEGAGEVIMFGGADPTVANSVPSDIEIRRNHVTRPTGWRGVWTVKNLLELKMGQRVLVEANVFENNWADAQTGAAFVLSSNNQDGRCTWCITSDVTVRSNVVRNTPFGFNLAAQGSNGGVNASLPMRRVTVTNNLVLGVSEAGGRTFMIGNGIDGVTITNNSGIGGTMDVLFIGTALPYTSFIFQNNITGGTYTLGTDDGSGAGTQALAKLQIPAANVAGNVFLNTTLGYLVPPGNVFGPAAGAGFANLAGGDLTLTAASPYRAAGVGGATPGADLAALAAATSGVKLQ